MRSEPVLELERPVSGADRRAVDRSYAGLAAIVAALTMLFAALSSAYLVRRGLSSGWKPVELPPVIWAGPCLLLLGSVLLHGKRQSRSSRILAIAIAAAAAIASGESCRELEAHGSTAATSAAAAFFFVFSGTFMACLLGGCTALLRSRSRAAIYFWDYLALLWVWLILILKVLP